MNSNIAPVIPMPAMTSGARRYGLRGEDSKNREVNLEEEDKSASRGRGVFEAKDGQMQVDTEEANNNQDVKADIPV